MFKEVADEGWHNSLASLITGIYPSEPPPCVTKCAGEAFAVRARFLFRLLKLQFATKTRFIATLDDLTSSRVIAVNTREPGLTEQYYEILDVYRNYLDYARDSNGTVIDDIVTVQRIVL
jgi:hypothetical protein